MTTFETKHQIKEIYVCEDSTTDFSLSGDNDEELKSDYFEFLKSLKNKSLFGEMKTRKRYTRFHLQKTLQLMGYKPHHALRITVSNKTSIYVCEDSVSDFSLSGDNDEEFKFINLVFIFKNFQLMGYKPHHAS
ncbi:p-loop ntpase domain-containing protein lpa1 [Anaeramoeba ignava]|uniref:P-loop ntpase domain-containing protein lpa1 n=1 Tax=Anaeramoeba ignava TaxID=1746090 RepID=A0A9Q0LQV3_ANAIG|nr:p-loop ntpase domain-containing protein lpa1 [Anaeramoeba ignava]